MCAWVWVHVSVSVMAWVWCGCDGVVWACVCDWACAWVWVWCGGDGVGVVCACRVDEQGKGTLQYARVTSSVHTSKINRKLYVIAPTHHHVSALRLSENSNAGVRVAFEMERNVRSSCMVPYCFESCA